MIEISVTQTYKRTGKVTKYTAIVKDGFSWTRFSDRELGMKTYLAIKKDDIRPCIYERGIIIEIWTGMKENDIANKIMDDNIKTIKMLNEKPEINGDMILEQTKKEVN
jgi:hypothetical protein